MIRDTAGQSCSFHKSQSELKESMQHDKKSWTFISCIDYSPQYWIECWQKAEITDQDVHLCWTAKTQVLKSTGIIISTIMIDVNSKPQCILLKTHISSTKFPTLCSFAIHGKLKRCSHTCIAVSQWKLILNFLSFPATSICDFRCQKLQLMLYITESKSSFSPS